MIDSMRTDLDATRDEVKQLTLEISLVAGDTSKIQDANDHFDKELKVFRAQNDEAELGITHLQGELENVTRSLEESTRMVIFTSVCLF